MRPEIDVSATDETRPDFHSHLHNPFGRSRTIACISRVALAVDSRVLAYGRSIEWIRLGRRNRDVEDVAELINGVNGIKRNNGNNGLTLDAVFRHGGIRRRR